MKVKELKEFLNLYKNDDEVVFKAQSGNTWEVDEILFAHRIITDQKREVCKLVLK